MMLTNCGAGLISDFVHPTKFRTVMEVAQECAGFSESTGEFAVPSQAIKCGQLLRKVAELKEAKALENGDTAVAESCVQFVKLCQVHWPELSAVAARNIIDRKRSGVKYLPLT